MAFLTDTHSLRDSLAIRWDAFRAQTKIRRERALIWRQTYQELNGLTDRELTDIGIARSDIGRIAREAADRI